MKIYFIIFIIFVFTLLTSNSYAEDTYAGYISGVYSTGQNVQFK